jgi:hypothetical protein
MIRLFTSFYPESNAVRSREIIECLKRNLELQQIDEVCLLLENTESPLHHSKLVTKPISHRPLYQDLFQWAREKQSWDDDLSIICNSDIYFDSAIAVLGRQLTPRLCVALTRWDVQPDNNVKLFYRNDSQDTWVFRGRIRKVIDDFQIGVPRCDNRMLYELRQAGYLVINPAFSVRSLHLHAGLREEYVQDKLSTFVSPPYAYLWPHNLHSLPMVCLHNMCHSDTKLGWQFDWQRVKRSMSARIVARIGRWLQTERQATDVS